MLDHCHQNIQSLLFGWMVCLVVTSVVNADGRVFMLDLRNSSGLEGFRDAEQACASQHARLASAEEFRHAVVECFFSPCTRGWLYGGTVGTTVCTIVGSALKAVDVRIDNATDDTAQLDAFCINDKDVPCGDPPSFPNAHLQGHSGFEMGDELLYTCVPGYVMPNGQSAFSLQCDSCGEWYGLVQTCAKDETESHVDYEDKFTDSYEEAERHQRPEEAQGQVYEEVYGAAYADRKKSQEQQETSFSVKVEEEHQDQREEDEVGGEVIDHDRTFEEAVKDGDKNEERAIEDFIGHPRWEQERREVVQTDAAAATEAPVSLLSQKHLFWFPSEAFQEQQPPVSTNPVMQTTQRASGAQSEESKEHESQERSHHQHPVDIDDNDDRDDHDDSRHDDQHIHEDSHYDDQDNGDSHQHEDHDDHVKHPVRYDDLDRHENHDDHDDHDDHYDMGEHEDERDRIRYGSQEYGDRDDAYDKHESYEDHDDVIDNHEDDDGEHLHDSKEHPDNHDRDNRDDHDNHDDRDGHVDSQEHYDLDQDDHRDHDDHDDHEHRDYDDRDSHEDDDGRQRVIFSIATDEGQNITQRAGGAKATTDETWLDGYPVVPEEMENGDSTTERVRPEDGGRGSVLKTTDRPNEVEIRRPVPYTNVPEEHGSPTTIPELEQEGVEDMWPSFTGTSAPSPDLLEPSDSPSFSDTLDYDTQQAAPTQSWPGDLTEHPFLDHGPAPPVHDNDDIFDGVIEEHTVHNLPGETGERGEAEGEMGGTICAGENCPSHPPSSTSRGPTVAAIIVAVCAVATAVIVGVWCYHRQQRKSSVYEMNGKDQSQSRQGQHIEMQQKV